MKDEGGKNLGRGLTMPWAKPKGRTNADEKADLQGFAQAPGRSFVWAGESRQRIEDETNSLIPKFDGLGVVRSFIWARSVVEWK
jgi:hypothetical protein